MFPLIFSEFCPKFLCGSFLRVLWKWHPWKVENSTFSTLKKMEIWGGRSLQWGCVAGRVQAISWKNYGQILHYAKPSHPVSEKNYRCFPVAKGSDEVAPGEKNPWRRLRAEGVPAQITSENAASNPGIIMSPSPDETDNTPSSVIQVRKHGGNYGFECAHCKRKSNAKSDMMRPMTRVNPRESHHQAT